MSDEKWCKFFLKVNACVIVTTLHLCLLAGDNCEVRDPRHGNLYDLKPLALNDTVVNAGEYTYYIRVCGKLSSNVCSTGDRSKAVSSCQEKRGPLGFQRVAGTVGILLCSWPIGGVRHRRCDRSEGVFLDAGSS